MIKIVLQSVTLYCPLNPNRPIGLGISADLYDGDFCTEVFEASTPVEALAKLFAAYPDYRHDLSLIAVEAL